MMSELSQDYVQCSRGYVTHRYLACDVQAACWTGDNNYVYTHHADLQHRCTISLAPLPPSFRCSNKMQDVPYTLVCDHRHDCHDGSDENFCIFPVCLSPEFLQCSNTPEVQMLCRQLVVYDPVRESMDKLNYNIYLNNVKEHVMLMGANMKVLDV